jgi:hypothetical protein
MFDKSRRQMLGGGLALGAGLLLAGCNKQRFKPLTREELEGPPKRDLGPERPPRYAPQPGAQMAGVIPRRTWASSGPVMSLINPMNGVNRVTVHHSGIISAEIRSNSDSARMLENIRRGHLSQGWADIGYHYIIDPAGRIWEGRSVRYQGAHVKENNEHNLAVMCMGNYDVERPTSELLASLDLFVAEQMRVYNVPINRVYTHQELKPTACPGRNLQGYMLATRARSGRLARA